MKKTKIIIGVSIFIVMISIIVLAVSTFKKDKINGLWDIDGNTKYEFDGYGKGKLIVPLNEYEFVYTLKEDKLFIDFTNIESDDVEYTYKLNGNILEITNTNEGLSFTLEKIEK